MRAEIHLNKYSVQFAVSVGVLVALVFASAPIAFGKVVPPSEIVSTSTQGPLTVLSAMKPNTQMGPSVQLTAIVPSQAGKALGGGIVVVGANEKMGGIAAF